MKPMKSPAPRHAAPEYKSGPLVKGALALSLGIAATSAATLAFQSHSPKSQETSLVQGIHGQVESHSTTEWCDVRTAATDDTCKLPMVDYTFNVEQCPQDVVAVQQGNPDSAIDRQVGRIGDGCHIGSIVVSYPEWNQPIFNDGAIVLWPGTPGQPVT